MIVLDPALLEQVLCNIREAARREKKNSRPAERFPVWLHVYDLSHTARLVLNNWLSKMSGLGAFHCGIEVLGAEWSFQAPPGDRGGDSDERTGLMCHHAKVHPVHVYKESVYLGESRLKVSDIWSLLLQLERQWLASSYHVVRRNCTDFADEFAVQLKVPECIPAWVHGIAKGYLRHTPLADVDSNILPRSCGSSVSVSGAESRAYSTTASNSVVASREIDFANRSIIFLRSNQELSEIDERLPVDAAAVDAPPEPSGPAPIGAAPTGPAPRPLGFVGDMFAWKPHSKASKAAVPLRPAELNVGSESRVFVVGNDPTASDDAMPRSSAGPPDLDEVQKALRKVDSAKRSIQGRHWWKEASDRSVNR